MRHFFLLGTCLGWLAWRADRRMGAANDFTEVCPKVRKYSAKACERCLENSMCPYESDTGTFWICSPSVQRCVHPSWNMTEVYRQCPEDETNFKTLGAQCVYICNDWRNTYDCARNCLNEDFPCRWRNDCIYPQGLDASSSVCLRGCTDHLDWLQTVYPAYDTCAKAISALGCTGDQNVARFCPHSCRSGECAWRCGSADSHFKEEPDLNGRLCWQMVEQEGYTCGQAIAMGMDCHCKCGPAYILKAYREGGAFVPRDELDDESLALRATAIAGYPFAVSVTGQGLRTENPAHAWGPRLKVIPSGGRCESTDLSEGLEGLSCQRPQDSGSVLLTSICTTPPAAAHMFLHRWMGLKLSKCGVHDVCHCNERCDINSNWKLIGNLTLNAPQDQGGVAKALPGCARAILTTPAPTGYTEGEKDIKEITRFTISLYRDFPETPLAISQVQHALRRALVTVLKAPSVLLGKQVPELSDVAVSSARRMRLLGETTAEERRANAAACSDDDVAFAQEAAKLSLQGVTTCAQLKSMIPDVNQMCLDPSLGSAVEKGCRKTCDLCGSSQSAQPGTQSNANAGQGIAPAPSPGQDDGALPFNVAVTTHTDLSGNNVVARVELLSDDPVPFLQRLHMELELTDLPASDIPAKLWANVTSGPTKEAVIEEEVEEEKPALSTTSIIFLAMGSAIGGSIALGCCFVGTWYCLTRDRRKSLVAPIDEVTVSEGGYRIKRVQAADPGATKPPPRLGCCGRCWKRCCCCCQRKLRKAESFTNMADNGVLRVGSNVKLCGLTQAHYNGLTGTVLSGPNDKGRYEVDLIVVNNNSLEEHQTLSFKPDNLRVLRADGREVPVKQPGDVRSPGSYRKARPPSAQDWADNNPSPPGSPFSP
mmetsp:Transcript_8453/g.14419  ORF Transcript_8453/g.14419 Transcript_8453/m.14419 type:complete len:879 (-) Transcript_8453:56-2692(-)